jgi:hypothetical protein
LQIADEGEGQCIDGESEYDAGMGGAVDNQFALCVVEGAGERPVSGAEGDPLMTAGSALESPIMEWDAEGTTVVGALTRVQFIAESRAEGLEEFMEG